MSTTSRPGTSEATLQRLLSDYPSARVSAVSADGTPIPVPPSVRLGPGHILSGVAGMKGYVAADRAGLIVAFDQALSAGSSVTVARLLHEPSTVLTVHLVDVIDSHGAVITVSADLDGGTDSRGQGLREVVVVAPRLARIHKSMTAEVLDIDEATTSILGWSREDMIGRRSLEFIHPDDQGLAIDNWAVLVTGEQEVSRVRLRQHARDGSWIWFEVAQSMTAREGRPCVLAEMVDVSKEMAAQEALEARERLLHQLTQALPLGVFQIDNQQRIAYTNDRLFDVVGAPHAATLTEQFAHVVPDDRPAVDAALEAVLGKGEDAQIDIRLLLGGEAPVRSCELSLRPLTGHDGQVVGAVGCITDVTERALLRRELEHRATYDSLTGCHNRATSMTELDRVLNHPEEPGIGTAVMFIDLDQFKSINDRFGHAVGDELLVATVDRLRGRLRDTATVGRLGGDEFLIICPQLPSAEAADELAQRIAVALREDIALSVGTVSVQASIGVAFTTDPTMRSEDLVARADHAMYESKRLGVASALLHPGSEASGVCR